MKPTEFIVENSIIAQEADDMHRDHEVQMARSQLYSTAQAAIQIHRLLRDVSEMEGLEGWVQTKIAIASEYLESVRDYLKYEAVSQGPEMMPFAEDAAHYAISRLIEDDAEDLAQKYGADSYVATAASNEQPANKPGETRYGPGYNPNEPNPVDVKPAPTRPSAGVNAAGQRAFQNFLNTQGADLKLDGIVGPKTKAARDEYFTKLQATMPRSALSDPDYDKKWKDYEQKRNMYMDMQAIAAAHHVKPAPGKPYTWLDSPNYKEIFKKYNLDPVTGLPAKPKLKEMATGGSSSAGGVATSIGGTTHKKTSGVPKKVGNSYKQKKVEVGKGIY